ncbi:energy transducer TonB [Flavobacterium sp. DG1-102-2]|uniref:energy transducer TonB n=1 Tax=Flavobacterium sp. DG1-102-2 TaxID=3081663 RepID=UPI0029496CB9|nr:energy transducer TonB [Flavobacterium sp. DG1-102-2]MDV6169151.1 energy transducer TonB [Flavobacterium sp. DG1-102-2]
MSKLNIFNKSWVDLVFEGRNKQYGAYQLRTENPKTTVRALIIGALLFIFLVATPMIADKLGDMASKEDDNVDKVIEVVDIPEPPKVEEVLPPPPPPVEQQQAPKSIVEEVKLKPLVAAKKEEVPEDPPKTEQFKEADPSSRNAEASPTGDINIGKPSGDLDKGVEAPDNTVYTTAGLQVQPDFPGGLGAFNNYILKNFRIPEVDRDMQARIYVSFVVEKDGSLTAIKVLRDPGYGLGKEAERVLKSLKIKWNPGIQNGKPVRTSFNLPITINIKS